MFDQDASTLRKISRSSMLKIIFSTILFANIVTPNAPAKSYTLGFFHMRTPISAGAFWSRYTNAMEAAAEDLGLKIKYYYANESPTLMIRQFKNAAMHREADVLVFHNFKNLGPQLIKIAEQYQIPAFLINAGLQASDNMGKPREKYKHWIGEMLPDDQYAGYMLAQILTDAAKKAGKTATSGKYQGKVEIIGLAGNVSDGAAVMRNNGLKQYVNEKNDAVLHQILPAQWQPDIAAEKYLTMMKRYPGTQVIWSANDQMIVGKMSNGHMVEGVLEQIKKSSLKPGRDIFVGGINWVPLAIDAVKSGEMTTTIGGHFFEGAWVAIVLYDYLNGIDFASESVRMRSKMGIINHKNVQQYLNLDTLFAKENLSKIDFSQYSKKINPTLQKYDFNMEEVIGRKKQYN